VTKKGFSGGLRLEKHLSSMPTHEIVTSAPLSLCFCTHPNELTMMPDSWFLTAVSKSLHPELLSQWTPIWHVNCKKMHITRFQNQQQMVISTQSRLKERDGGGERDLHKIHVVHTVQVITRQNKHILHILVFSILAPYHRGPQPTNPLCQNPNLPNP